MVPRWVYVLLKGLTHTLQEGVSCSPRPRYICLQPRDNGDYAVHLLCVSYHPDTTGHDPKLTDYQGVRCRPP